MDINFSTINYIQNPFEIDFKADHLQFLASMDGPTVIDIPGIDQTRCRVAVALIHGDEPSGLIAMHQWLKTYCSVQAQGLKPATNIRFIICSPEAAQAEPVLTKRYLNKGEDLNRCFGSDERTGYKLRAHLINQAITEINPEAVIDFHNTPGKAPAFAVSAQDTETNISITSIFCSTLILSEIKIGALLEQDFNCPNLTIECGGKDDEQANKIAFNGLQRFCSNESLLNCHHINPVEIVHTPLRLRVENGTKVHYSAKNINEDGIVLFDNLEDFNFGATKRGEAIGWLNNRGLEHLALVDADDEDVITDFFTLEKDKLVCATNMRIFMAATNHKLAQKDCIFYLVKQRDIARSNIPDIDYFVPM